MEASATNTVTITGTTYSWGVLNIVFFLLNLLSVKLNLFSVGSLFRFQNPIKKSLVILQRTMN